MTQAAKDNVDRGGVGSATEVTMALAGNPNSGKTTLFNALTAGRQHVGNYPGVTVEKKEGFRRWGTTAIKVIDLPGTYSLTAFSIEEIVARDVIIHDKPDVVVDVLDAGNLERNLYLAVQIMELGVPLVLALNMADVARQRGIEFDLEQLQRLVGVPIVPTVGHKRSGIEDLLSASVKVAGQSRPEPLHLDYGPEIEAELSRIQQLIEQTGATVKDVPTRWLAIKLLEGDSDIRNRVNNAEVTSAVDRAIEHLSSLLGDVPEALIADRRYGFISGACQETVRSTVESRHTASDHIDTVVTNRVLGLPIFLGMMYLVFHLTFTIGDPLMDLIESGFAWLGIAVGGLWAPGSDSLLRGLLVDGIIGGVGGVLVFLPNILLLFFAIAVLEDSGYMARAAFLMDRLMHKIGLHGKSFVPMLIGFGCTVPAIMATRTLESRRDRLTTMLVLPLMSCGARLPIYALIIPAFFPRAWHAPMLWIIYMVGIALAVGAAKVLRMTLLRGESPPFVMELPPYRMPTVKSIGLHMWNRAGAYLKKAATIILGISIILWAMQQWPGLPEQQAATFELQRLALETDPGVPAHEREIARRGLAHAEAEAALKHSLMGRVGRGLEPVMRPAGFDWKISTAIVGAFAAKEVFVSQLGILYSLGQEPDEEADSLRDRLKEDYSPLIGLCIMLFMLISVPCVATLVMTRRESGAMKWALFQLIGLTLMAYVITVAVYQAGSLLGIGV